MFAPRSGTVRLIASLAVTVAAVAACSSDSVTRPTTTDNVTLIGHFDSVRTELNAPGSIRDTQLTALITLLGLGAPVQNITLSVDGTSSTYKAVGGYEVSDDIEGHAADSVYALVAWQGDDADSVALFLVFQDLVDAALTTSDSSFASGAGATGTVTAAAPNGSCTSYIDHLPPDITIPPGLACLLETATPQADATVSSDGDTPSSHHLVLPSQAVNGIRIEGQTTT